MRHIRLHFLFSAFITVLGTAAGVILMIYGAGTSGATVYLVSAILLLIAVASAVIWIRKYRWIKIARLIAGNPILQIRTAIIRDLSGEAEQMEECENTEVFISYFGILLAEKIIKFNQDGIWLIAVEIGKDFISLTYGAEKRTQNIRLLRPAIDPAAMTEICERFRYETGITPTLLFNGREQR